MTEQAEHRRSWRKWIVGGVGGLLGLIALLALTIAVGLQTSPARRFVHAQANRALSGLFRGQVVIDGIEELGWRGAGGVDARVFDVEGREVIRARGLRAELSILGLAWEFLGGNPRQRVQLTRVSAEDVTVTLYEDAEAGVSLAAAFAPASPSDPTTATEGTVDVELSHIALARVHARGAVGEQVIDADARDLEARFEYALGALLLQIERANVVARQLPGALDPDVKLTGELAIASGENAPLRVAAALEGLALGAPLDGEFEMDGDQLSGRIDLWDIAPETLNQRVSSLQVGSRTALHVEATGQLSALYVALACENDALLLDARGEITLDAGFGADIEATLSDVDLSGIVAAPRSKMDAVLRLRANQEGEAPLELVHQLLVLPSTVAGRPTPALTLDGYVALEDATTQLGGDLRVAETGALATGSYWANLAESGASNAGAILEVRLIDPPRLRAISGIEVRGSSQIAGSWKSDDVVFAEVNMSIERARYQGEGIDNLRLNGRVFGTTAEPRAKATLGFDVAGGRVTANVDANARVQTVELQATRLGASKLTQVANLPSIVQRGTIDLTVSARRAGRELTGTLDVNARDLDIAGLRDASIDGQVSLDPKGKGNARVAARLGRLGKVSVQVRDVMTSQLQSLQLGRLEGELQTDGDVSLSELSTLIAKSDLPVEQLEGRIAFSGTAGRKRGQRPDLQLQVHTEGLSFIGKREPHPEFSATASAIEQAPLAVHGVDVEATLDARGESDDVALRVEARNRRATLVVVEAQTTAAAAWGALQLPERLQTLPLSASVKAPSQPLQRLPAVIRPGDLTGFVAVEAQLDGSIARPEVRVAVEAKALRTDTEAPALDVNLKGSYQTTGGQVEVSARGERARAEVDVNWRGDLARVSEMNEQQSPLRGEVSAHWTAFPSAMIPALVERQVSGELDGDIQLTDWGEDAKLSAKVSSRTLKIDKLPVTKLALNAKVEQQRLVSDVVVELSKSSLKANVDSRVRWGKRPLPVVERDAHARLEARAFQLASLSPLIAGQVSELAGLLTARADLKITPESTELTGSADLKDGVLQIPALGQRLSGITARVAVGDNRVRLQELTADGSTGRIRASGVAELDGFSLARAEGDLKIASDEKIPVTLEGVAIGDASGTVHAVYVNHPTQPRLTVDVPVFLLTTPETGGYGLQELERPSDVRVGVRRADGKFVSLPVQPLEPDSDESEKKPSGPPLHILVRLGDVTVERGTIATARLGGELQVETGDPTRVAGRIEISGGELDVQGKQFEVERGVVVFDGGDASNPTITATARWDSPTDHAVYAEYVGDVETGKIKLHSEPPLTQDEIASLLLFGTLDGTMGSGESNQASMAVSVAGGTVAQGLNRALSSFTNLDLSARVDTSTGSPRPELVFQVSPRVSAKVSRAVGEPNAGEAPDRTFLTLELRLQRAWALSAVFGDRGGSALDLIWRRRY